MKLNKKPKAICAIKLCDKKLYARGLCEKHYRRWYVHGDPNYSQTNRTTTRHRSSNIRIQGQKAYVELTSGYEAIIDTQDIPLIQGKIWYVSNAKRKTKYAIESRSQKRMHNLIMQTPKGLVCDHIDRNGLNNTRSNLRICTIQQNCWNQSGRSSMKGVSYNRNNRKWSAAITKDGTQWNLGYFTDKEDAGIVYNVAAQLFFGQYANLNPL